MKKYDKIKRLGHRATEGILNGGTLDVTEKLDGNNFRVTVEDGEAVRKLHNLIGRGDVNFREVLGKSYEIDILWEA